jgi:murein L,D-transpeptidase YafK
MTMRVALAAGVLLALAACQDQSTLSSTRHLAPIPPATMSLMAAKGMSKSDPILVRAYKKESELEVWKRGNDGRYALLKTYPICRWSGQLGPKVREGDRQAPEGFYTITPAQMNPNSAYYLSFDTGYPNAFDRAHGRTGAHLMVHGTCSSSGCFAMTDEAIAEVYAVAREAFAGGQRGFQFQSLPFRMTAENLAKHRADPNMAFWQNLKEGADYFEVTKDEPRVSVANMRYAFTTSSAADAAAVAQKKAEDDQKVAELVGKGMPAVKVVYEDGGQHASFHDTMVATAGGETGSAFAFLDTRPKRNLGDVSRPEALAAGPREIPIEGPATKAKADGKTQATTDGKAKAAKSRANQQPAAAIPGASQAKPQAAAPAPDRRAALSAAVMPGAQPVLAGGSGFAPLN